MLVDDWLCNCGNELGGVVVKFANVPIGDARVFDDPFFGLLYQGSQFSRSLNRLRSCVFDGDNAGRAMRRLGGWHAVAFQKSMEPESDKEFAFAKLVRKTTLS